MGQDHVLNCKNNYKDKEKQTETTHTHSTHPPKTMQTEKDPFQSEIKSKKSTTTVLSDIQNKIPSIVRKPTSKKIQTYIPQHQNLLKVAYKQFEGSEKMGSKWVEKGGKCLADILEGRYNTTMHFPQPQVVALVESLVYALAYLQKGAIKHHDFYPINIYYSNGIFKLANPESIQFSAYALTQQRRRFSFLSPELIGNIVQNTPEDDLPPQMLFEADIFAIGMIALQFCTLQSSTDCYDEQNYELIDQVVKERLGKVAQLYSANIADCIAQMLVYNFEDRVSVQDLALLVYLNSPSEKVEVAQQQQQQTAKTSSRVSTSLPPLPKQNSTSIQQLKNQSQQIQQQNGSTMQHPHLRNPPQSQQVNAPNAPNNLNMPTPNHTYSHIGLNNQSLLSSSSLQNKLKVIEQIHQKPQFQQDSDGQFSSLPSNFAPGNSQMQPLRTQQPQPQRIIVNGPFPPNQHPQFLQQIPPQHFMQQSIEIPHQIAHQIPPQIAHQMPHQMPHQMGPQIRQVILPPGQHLPPQLLKQQNLPLNIIHNAIPGSLIQPPNIVHQSRISASPIHNLPYSSIRSTPTASQHEAPISRFEQQSRFRPSQIELQSPYEGNIHHSIHSIYTPRQSIVQKDYDLLYKPTFKQSLQLSSQYQTASYKPGNYSSSNYSSEKDYLPTSTMGKYQPPNTFSSKYTKQRDQNGQTLEQRVDRILQMSKGMK